MTCLSQRTARASVASDIFTGGQELDVDVENPLPIDPACWALGCT